MDGLGVCGQRGLGHGWTRGGVARGVWAMDGPGGCGQRGLGHGWTRGVWPEGSGPWMDQGGVARGVWAMDGPGGCGQRGLGHGWTRGAWPEGPRKGVYGLWMMGGLRDFGLVRVWLEGPVEAGKRGGLGECGLADRGLVGRLKDGGWVDRWVLD